MGKAANRRKFERDEGRQSRKVRRRERIPKEYVDDTPKNVPVPKKVPILEPKTQLQSEYMEYIRTRPFVIGTGYAGTGKTYIPVRMACDMYINKDIKRIVLARPAVSASKSLGFFKGDKVEKMKDWLAPVWSTLLEVFSESKLDTMIEYNELICVPLETIKGNSWKDAFVIIDEAEDCNIKELKSILTRIGTNTTMVICGDVTQTDLSHSGLDTLLDLVDSNQRFNRMISYVNFCDPEDIVRSEACKEIILGFEEVGL